MKRKIIIRIIAAVLCVAAAVATLSSCFDINHLPAGVLQYSTVSPENHYRIDVYLCDGGATVDYAIKCTVVRFGDGASRNIYWQYHEENATVVWIDDTHVEINGRRLDILKDQYDYRYDK